MSVVGRDHLPCSAAMLRRPLPFCAGQLHHGDLDGCWGAANGLVIKATRANVTLIVFYNSIHCCPANDDEDKDDEFRAPLYKNVEVKGIQVRMKWCSSCHFYRPPRCSHCSVCDHCVEVSAHRARGQRAGEFVWAESIKGISAEGTMGWRTADLNNPFLRAPSRSLKKGSGCVEGGKNALLLETFFSLFFRFRISTITAPGSTTALGGETTVTSSCSCCRSPFTCSASSPSASSMS